MKNPEFNSSEQVPTNRAQACFRVLLWFMPAVFAVASYWGIWVTGFGRTGNSVIVAWVVLNLCFIGLAGWFDAVLARPIRRLAPGKRTAVIIGSMVGFFAIQFVLIPLIVAATAFAFHALNDY